MPDPVLVIPGLDGHAGLLEAVAPALLPGLRPVFYDHRLDRAEGGAEGMAERALRVLDATVGTNEPAYVCGESFGSVVALALARRQPDRVRGLILLSGFGSYPALPGALGRLGMRAWRRLGDRAAFPLVVAARPLGTFSQIGLRAPRSTRRAYLSHPFPDLSAYRAKCQLALEFDARPWLMEVRIPTLLLCASWDPVVPTSCSRELAAGIAGSQLVRLGAGHASYLGAPEPVGQAITAWRATLTTATPSTGGT